MERVSFTQFDPFEDTERKRGWTWRYRWAACFTQFDPFEDTESAQAHRLAPPDARFHPIRSVRGY